MSKKRKSFTGDEKFHILMDAEASGVASTCRKYEISQTIFYRWRSKFEQEGKPGLEGSHQRKVNDELSNLKLENQRLKQLVADQALELKVKEELLKKTFQRNKNVKKLLR